jgi:hypothetical protein
MNTAFLLMAQYNGASVIPTERVCADYFSHLTPTQFLLKINKGDIDLPLVRIEASRKTATGVHLIDLAAWIDARREAAQKENDQMQGRR